MKRLILTISFLIFFLSEFYGQGYVVTQPLEAGANLSTRYTVTVNGISVPVIKVKGNVAPSYVQFSFAGSVNVVVTVNEAVGTYTLTPKSYNVVSSKSGNNILFTLDKPRHLILHHVNSSTESLGIFAESIEENKPTIGGSVLNVMDYGVDNTGATDNSTQIQNALNAVASGGTLYFPAGKYAANYLQPNTNTTVYLAAGAVLQAISNSASVSSMFYIGNSGVKIRGRGVIDGRGDIHRPAGKMYNLIQEQANDFTLEGIILRTTPAWHIMTYGSNLMFKNVKWINNYDYPNGDGIGTTGANITVDDCIFMVTDDPLALHTTSTAGNMNTIVKNTVLFNQIAGGRFFLLGYYNAEGTTSRWDAENLDMANGYRVIDNTTGNAFEIWQQKGVLSECLFQNIRLENPVNSLVAGVTKWDFTQWIPGDVGNGRISNITFKEIQQEYFGTLGSVVPSLCPWTNGRNTFNSGGYASVTSSNTIDNIKFDNYYVNGTRVTNTTEGQFDIGSYVSNITFPSTSSIKVNITANDLLADESGSNGGQFTVSRTGSTSEALTVYYTIHGTAVNGTHYNTINNSLTMAAGITSATIAITPTTDGGGTDYKTVFLSLDKNSNYMVDANYHAVVTIVNGSLGNSSNLALNKTTTTSSIEGTGYEGSKAVDGGGTTRWASLGSDPQWIYVDLGATYSISQVKLTWETASAKSYQIQLSNDASTWTNIYTTTTGDGATDDLTGLSGSGRYIRMYGTVRNTVYGYSLWEFEVYGSAADVTAPSAPTGLASSGITQTSYTLSWTASTDNVAVTGYELNIGGYIATTTALSYIVTGQGCGTTNSVTVRARDAAGNWSAQSTALNATTSACTGGGVNLALNKPTTTSSIEGTGYEGSKAVDGSGTTRWTSLYTDPQWIYVDLGATYSISRVKLTWEAAYAKSYQIQVSNDASTWTNIYTTTTGDGATDDLSGLSGSGRYIRMYGTVRNNTAWAYSLWEFEVYGTAIASNLALNKTTTTSSIEGTGYEGSKAVDGSGTTRWASLGSDPQWIYVDLGATYNISRVKLTWEAASAKSYQIQVSANASTWTNIYTTTTGDGATDDLTGLSGSGRYIRMYGTVRNTTYGYSLWEFEVYGTSSGSSSGRFITRDISPIPNDDSEAIVIFPNPAEDIVYLQNTKPNSIVKIFTLDGKIVLTHFIDNGNADINVRNLSSGVYFMSIQNEASMLMRKLLIR